MTYGLLSKIGWINYLKSLKVRILQKCNRLTQTLVLVKGLDSQMVLTGIWLRAAHLNC